MTDLGPLVNTFSIVGIDPVTGDLGVAVATKYIAVGSSVPHAKPNVAAIAVQAHANPALAPKGMALLAAGQSPADVIGALMADDAGREYRQLGIVDAQGRVATYTGSLCEAWAGGRVGPYCAAQGNMLLGESTVAAMVEWFATHDGPLADRLVDALWAGERAGGDKRGRQSSALLVVRPDAGIAVYDDNLIDLRIDSDPHPCRRLRDLLGEYYAVQIRTPRDQYLRLTEERVAQIQLALYRLGRYLGAHHGRFDDATRAALWGFCVAENQKARWAEDGTIDPRLLNYLTEFADWSRQ